MSADLHLDLDPQFGVRGSLERALRTAVRSGRLAPGVRLPPSRVLAIDLGVAGNTVAEVYTQLVAEGYLESGRSAGTRVAPRRAAGREPATRRLGGAPLSEPVRYDLRPGRPDLSLFPQAAWLAALRRVLAGNSAGALSYTGS
jgi:GntR family transcriptional regulator/MocR family aminotransferase